MKIKIFTTDSRPMMGGIAEYVHGLATALAERHEVTVCSTVSDSAQTPCDYRVIELAQRPRRNLGKAITDRFYLTRKGNTYLYYRALKKACQKDMERILDPQDVLLFAHWTPEHYYWCQEALARKHPYYLVVHGLEGTIPLDGRTSEWRKNNLKESKKIIANSHASAQKVSECLKEPIDVSVIYPGIASDFYQKFSTEGIQRKRLQFGVGESEVLILTTGRMIPRKGTARLIEVLSRLRQASYPVHLWVLGDGPERSRLEKQAADRSMQNYVRFFGNVTEDEKMICYSACDVFAMPTTYKTPLDWEGFGIVFLEAALYGKSSIGGRSGGVAEALTHNETGILVSDQNDEELTEALLRLLRDPNLRVSMGEAARRRAMEQFLWSHQAKKFETLVLNG